MLRRLTVGRAFALLLLGIGLGAALYLARHLRPEELGKQVDAALREVLAADFKYQRVELDLAVGVRVHNLRVLYPDTIAAVEVEEVVLTVDHDKLLSGEVVLRQIDLDGLVVRLRPDPAGTGELPGLPGVLRPAAGHERAGPPPRVRIRPGRRGSRLEVLDARPLRGGVTLSLDCLEAEARADGPLYALTATFSGSRLDEMRLNLVLDPDAQSLDVDARVRGLRWTRDDLKFLDDETRRGLPPVELAGRADIDCEASLELGPLRIAGYRCEARLQGLEGELGNLHTGERAGLPFRLSGGRGRLEFTDGRLALEGFRGVFHTSGGEPGRLSAGMRMDFNGVEPTFDLELHGEGLRTETQDLRLLLPPDVVHTIVDQFLPAGTFDFDVIISQRPPLAEKVVATMQLRDGRFEYAGPLDQATGRRFGFRYPLYRCRGSIEVETHVAGPHGDSEVFTIRGLEGFARIARPRPGGPTEVAARADGRVVTYADDGSGVNREDMRVRIRVDDIPIDARLARAFASTPRGMPFREFDLTGLARRVDISLERDGFGLNQPLAYYAVQLEDCSMSYERFPLQIDAIHGRVSAQDLPAAADGRERRLLRLDDLEGRGPSGGTVHGEGSVYQTGEGNEQLDIRIQARDLALGPALESALRRSSLAPGGLGDLWTRLRPAGRVGADIRVRAPEPTEVAILLDGNARLDGFVDRDVPVTELEGRVRYGSGAVALEGLTGMARGTRFHVDGAVAAGGAFDLSGHVSGMTLDPGTRALLGELSPETERTIERLELAPESRLDVGLDVRRASRDGPVEVHSRFEKLELKAVVAGLPIEIRGGPLSADGQRITAKDLWLRSGEAAVHVTAMDLPARESGGSGFGWATLDATNLAPVEHLQPLFGGGLARLLGHNLRVDLREYRVELHRDERTVVLNGAVDLRRHELLPEPVDALEPTGALELRPLTLLLPDRLGDPVRISGVIGYRSLNMNLPVPALDMGGELRVAEGVLGEEFTLKGSIVAGEVGVYRRRLDGLSLNLTLTPHYLRLGNIDGRFYGGSFRGDVDVHLDEPSAFRVRARATGVDLGELLEEDLPRSEPLTGTLDAALEFESPSGQPQDMRGHGEVRVRDGQLFKVPGLRRILAVMARATPLDGPRFKRAEVDFTLEGETLRIDRYHLSTAVNDIRGKGTLSIYGDLDVVVQPQVTRLIDLPRLINIPVLSALRDLWHKTIYEIRLEGTLDSPALRLRALPFLRKRSRRPFTQSSHAGRVERLRPRVLPG